MRVLKFLPALLLLGAPAFAEAATAERAPFGTMPDGTAVEAVTLRNAHGMQVRILAYGALIQQLLVPDAQGHSDDVVLGYDDLAGYLARHNYFGESIGRYANRIGGAAFTLDGTRYALARSDGENTLHGGTVGFGQRVWTIRAVNGGPRASVTLSLRSPDGDQGFPGNLDANVTYALDESDTLTMTYGATTDRPTVVNLTNHAYFNLAGATSGQSVLGAWLTVPAEHYTPTDKNLIPTGELRPVAGTAFDFRTPQQIGARIRDGRDQQLVLARGYDHNFVISMAPATAPRLIARVEDRTSGRVLEVTGTSPGVQVYSGNFLDGTIVGKGGVAYRQGDALCLEPQLFPDTPNKPAFGSARLAPGEHYTSTMAFHFTIRKPG
jgi:aldose 1-epimerase